jgi:hypothetical protein
MKGYEDIVATLLFLTVVLIGGYFYLDSLPKKQIFHGKEASQMLERGVKLEVDKPVTITFESASKRTE